MFSALSKQKESIEQETTEHVPYITQNIVHGHCENITKIFIYYHLASKYVQLI